MGTAPSRHNPAGYGEANKNNSPPDSLVGTPLRVGTDTASPSSCMSPSAAATTGGAAGVRAAFGPPPTSALLPQCQRVAERSLTQGVDLGHTFDSAAGTNKMNVAADGRLGEHESNARYYEYINTPL